MMELLQIAFIVLKLCGVIKWHWLLVLSPLWLTLITLIIVIVVRIIINKK